MSDPVIGMFLKFYIFCCYNLYASHSGTFSKKSRILNGRRPFAKDPELFNYEYDSEADWDEEEEAGEDIANSDGEDDDSECGNCLFITLS